LSVDVLGSFKKDAVSIGVNGPTDPFGRPRDIFLGGPTRQVLTAIISDNTSVMAVTKYEVDKLKLYAGYERIEFANPSDPQTAFTDVAGDFICQNCNIDPATAKPGTVLGPVFNGTNINNRFYNTHRITQLAWVGARYALTDSLNISGAFYHEWQNDFIGGSVVNQSAVNPTGFTCSQVSTVSSRCQGTRDSASVLLDWKFAPKWDTYLAQLYSRNTGGLDNGFLQRDVWSTTAGVRFRW
jgi:predicted porin